MIRVMIKKPYEAPYTADIENELETLQGIVGGHIECVPLPGVPGTTIICNEEGKLLGLAPNLLIGGDVICGTVAVAGIDGEEFAGLRGRQISDAWLRLTVRALHRPEDVARATGYITP